MTLLDRFRTRPQRHADPAVRLAYVAELPLSERDQIAAVAREDEDVRVRRAAVAKLMDPVELAAVVRGDADLGVRNDAIAMLRDIALDAFEGIGQSERLAAVAALEDQRTLAHIARTSRCAEIARQALARTTGVHAVLSIARQAALEPVRLAALDRLTDRESLLAVAVHCEFKDAAVAAVERLREQADLAQVAARGKNKSAVKRARAAIREVDDAAALDAAAANEVTGKHELTPSEAAVPTGVESDPSRPAATIQASDVRSAPIRAEPVGDEAAGASDLAASAIGELAPEEQQEQQERLAALEQESREEAARQAERHRTRLSELVHEAEAAAAAADLPGGRRRLELARREWNDTPAALVDAELRRRFAAAEAGLSEREARAHEAEARTRRDGLRRMQHLIDRVEPLAAKGDLTLRIGERALKELRTALGNIPPLPSRADYEQVVHRLKAAQATLTPKVLELREAAEWQQWANLGLQEQLCEKMEALRSVEDPDQLIRSIRELQTRWREAADVPRSRGEALWRRFKTVHDELWSRCESHFAAMAEERASNLAKKTALCERVEAVKESTNWLQTAEDIKRAQAEWKAIGPVTRGSERAVWERFRAACDHFFTRRQADLARRKAMWAANFAKKETLCLRVEALSESDQWDATFAEIRRLQAEWKTVGPVKKSRSDAIWQRFRAGCDAFFARYSQRHDAARAERIAAREGICAELEALAGREQTPESGTPPQEILTGVRALRSRWQQEIAARSIDRAHAAALDERFAAAFARVVAAWPEAFADTDLDPVANRRRMADLVARMEDLAASVAGSPRSSDDLPPAHLAAMLKEALAANTIGGKVDAESRRRAAQEEARQAQATWSRIGPVGDDARRELAPRFQRAVRRILEL
jgi:hypothetical protein